jgi:hypothetical protein
MDCRRCGGLVVEALQTVPYIAPGPRVVELRHVRALQCGSCGHVDVDVPERRILDALARRVVAQGADTMPELVFEQGRWRVAGWKASSE